MFLKNISKKRGNIFLAILIFNLVASSVLFVNPVQTQAYTIEDALAAYEAYQNIISGQGGSSETDLLNVILSFFDPSTDQTQASGILSTAVDAYCATLGLPPGICSALLDTILNSGGAGASTQTQEFKAPKLDQYKWEVGIPGFVAKGGVVPLEEEGVSGLIKAIIAWAFKLAGVLAFAMIVYAGFQYLTSGGNTAQQKDAQERIVSAIIGIILLFAFYIILYTINPDILRTSL